MLSALLIQLFGRDVIDRLARTGFDTTEAIARAGVDRLSDEGGIPASLARRIIAVAVETPVADEPEPEPAGAPPKRAKVKSAARGRKPGTTRPDPRTAPDLDGPTGPDTGAVPDDETSGWPTNSLDPFVDDVGLVSFMGLAARGGPSSSSKFSVAEEILDAGPAPIPFGDEPGAADPAPSPARLAAAPDLPLESKTAPGPTAAPANPSASESASRSGKTPAARPTAVSAAGSVVGASEGAHASPPHARPGAASVAGSFWGFGARVEKIRTLPFPDENPREPGPQTRGLDARARSGSQDLPRRRSSDGH
jgi:hypothetical protein